MGGRVHLVSLSRFWRSGVSQFAGTETNCSLSLDDACPDLLAVGLQNSFSVKDQPILMSV